MPDRTAIKQRQQEIWASSDFAMIATGSTIVGDCFAKVSMCGRARRCSMWPPVAVTPRSPPAAAGAT